MLLAKDALLVLTVVLRVVILVANDERVVVSVLFVDAIPADNDELFDVIEDCKPSMRIAAEDEFVVIVAFAVVIEDWKDADAA